MVGSKKTQWPTVHVTDEDKGIIQLIKGFDGRLRSIDSKDLLLIAAALAVKLDLPYDDGIKSKKVDVISYANLNRENYRQYRHLIAAIYFMTKANKNISVMSDVKDMVANFEDYAHRGILYLKNRYLETRGGDDELFLNFTQLLGEQKNKPQEE